MSIHIREQRGSHILLTPIEEVDVMGRKIGCSFMHSGRRWVGLLNHDKMAAHPSPKMNAIALLGIFGTDPRSSTESFPQTISNDCIRQCILE